MFAALSVDWRIIGRQGGADPFADVLLRAPFYFGQGTACETLNRSAQMIGLNSRRSGRSGARCVRSDLRRTKRGLPLSDTHARSGPISPPSINGLHSYQHREFGQAIGADNTAKCTNYLYAPLIAASIASPPFPRPPKASRFPKPSGRKWCLRFGAATLPRRKDGCGTNGRGR